MKFFKTLTVLIALIFLVGCTQTACPIVQCPVCKVTPEVQKDLVFTNFIDVGQGDSILIQSGQTEMLVDCGKNTAGQTVVDFLKEKKVGDLEYLVITHTDSDHLGGCDDVLQAYNVHTVIVNGDTADTQSYEEVIEELDIESIHTATKEDTWSIGPSEVRVIQANNGLTPNENSIVLKLTYGTTDLLLTGDCDRECEELLLTKDIQSEILKVAHHGSKYGTGNAFLEKVLPRAAIITVGNNSYGHPAPETIDRLNQEGILIYRTDFDKDITITFNGNSYEIV